MQSDRIAVSIRMRPLNCASYRQHETQCNSIQLDTDAKTVTIAYNNMEDFAKCYQFDNVYGPSDSQNTVYQTSVFPLIQGIMNGEDVCVMT
jgi:hypothetical protein